MDRWTIYQWRSEKAPHQLRYVTDSVEALTSQDALVNCIAEAVNRGRASLYFDGIYIVVSSRGGNWQGGVFRVTDHEVEPAYTSFDGGV